MMQSESNSFRQVDEKHVSTEVKCLAWSPKMDLIAVANIQSEVILYRLSWQKVWTLNSQAEDMTIAALAWRPDGKVLSVGYHGYQCGKVLLVDVENSEILHVISETGHVTSLNWISEAAPSTEYSANNSKMCFEERWNQFLPKLPVLNKSFGTVNKGHTDENVEDPKRLKGQSELNLLIVGNQIGKVCLYAYGIFPAGQLDTTQTTPSFPVGQVLSAHFSPNLKVLVLMLLVETNSCSEQLYIVTYDSTLIAERHTEISIIALKYGQVASLLSYLDATIKQMSEAWEDILMEMDSKLMKFAEDKQKMSTGTVSNDFLELLMFGTPSDELQLFLLNDLTEKGLKKLGHSIETSYSNIQRLVLKQLQSVIQAIIYHLNDLNGMSQWFDDFGVLGLIHSVIQEAITCANSFMLKASELHLVIDGSMKNFKAFFRWLYVVIQRLADEPVPPELNKMTQQSLNFVADFLKEHFTEEYDGDGKTKPGFRLERVGQYLKNEDLQDPADNSENHWIKFVESHPNLKNSPLLYPVNTKKSLIQSHNDLKKVLEKVLGKPSVTIGETLTYSHVYQLYTGSKLTAADSNTLPTVTQFTVNNVNSDSYYLYSVVLLGETPADKFYIIRQKGPRLEAVAVKFGQLGARNTTDKCQHHRILDIGHYDDQTISLLLVEDEEDKLPVLLQMALSNIRDIEYTIINQYSGDFNINQLVCIDAAVNVDDSNFRRLENMKAHCFAVSGTRKVSCVVFSSRRRVRLFYMDVEDEDDDDDRADTSATGGSTVDTGEDDEDKENTSMEL